MGKCKQINNSNLPYMSDVIHSLDIQFMSEKLTQKYELQR